MRNRFLSASLANAVVVASFVLAAGVAGDAFAAVYKCVNDRSAPPGSNPIYQDTPCPPGKELRNFDTDPAEVSVVPHQEFVEGATSVAPRAAKPAPATSTKTDRKKDVVTAGSTADRKFITPGMSEAEVVAKIGNPDITGNGRGRKSSRWSYLPTAGDPQTITTIVFESGRVIEVERKVVH